MRVLVACERSGVVREAFRKRGHDAWSCDLEPAMDISQFHIQKDAVEVSRWPGVRSAKSYWHLMLAFPECRFLSSSGMHRTGKPNQRTQADVEAAASFFMQMVAAPVEKIAVENSIGIMSTRYRKPDQIIHPYQFGEDAEKHTCLWLKNLPRLSSTEFFLPRLVCQNRECGETLTWEDLPLKHHICLVCNMGKMLPRWSNQTDSGQNRLGPSPTRSAIRARTYQGIADAMAEQWGRYELSKM